MSLASSAAAADDHTPVHVASARAANAAEAARELREKLPCSGLAAILAFFSPFYDAQDFAGAMAAQFPDVPVYGCSTAGELTLEGLSDDSIVALGFAAADFTIAAEPILDAAGFNIAQARDHVQTLRNQLARLEPVAIGRSSFGLLLVDGLCRREETLISAINACLDDIPVVGGSAGDRLHFQRTHILFNGEAHSNAALLLLVSTDLPFRLFKCDSFEPTSVKLVVTEADIERRIVRELNAEPAAEEYARIAGVPIKDLDDFTFAAHPVIVRVAGEYYARSIQQANPDGSLTFYCAIDEGLVLTAAGRLDTLEKAAELFDATEADIGDVSLYIGFDCIHRRLDAQQRQIERDLSDLYRRHRVVGFNTYGEQFRSMHLNQTLSGVAIGRRPA